MTAQNWLVVTTRPHREAWAAENCLAQGFETYRPLIMRKQRIPARIIAVPLFPSYMFVRFTESWPRLLSTFGVSGLIRHGDDPATIHDAIIHQLQQREIDGIVQLPKPKPGMRVNIVRGSFEGKTGLYLGQCTHDRTRILLDVLGRKLKVFIAADAVQLAA